MGAPAERAKRDVKGALTLAEGGEAGWQVPVLLVAAGRREGLGELVRALDDHWAWLSADDRLAARRHAQAEFWLADAIRQRFGREGLKRGGDLRLMDGEAPFGRLAQVTRRLGG
jgi:LAO/AO transport system kinase